MNQEQQVRRNPTEFLSTIIGKNVSVKLNSGIEYRGILACLDGYMNIALEQTKEYVNGLQKNDYGDAFIRGNNGQLSLTVTNRKPRENLAAATPIPRISILNAPHPFPFPLQRHPYSDNPY